MLHSISISRACQGESIAIAHGCVQQPDGRLLEYGVERAKGGQRFRISNDQVKSLAELAALLPFQVITPEVSELLLGGPRNRRRFLDWGLFHVEPSYHGIWKDYRLALKQRNALLRQHAKAAHFKPWDTQLAELAKALDRLRAPYFKDWSEQFQAFLLQLTDTPCCIRYDKGWDKKETGKSLKTILEEQLEQDMQRQYTYSGAHHADVVLDSVALKAKQHLSRGQQKIILIALKLAQAQLIDKPCMYLMDDITVELDQSHIQRLFEQLLQLPGQFFLTSVHPVPEAWQQEGQVFDLDSVVL